MAGIREITQMCRDGEWDAAHAQVRQELDAAPGDIWTQRKMGWVQYYRIKDAAEANRLEDVLDGLSQLSRLDQLRPSDDQMLYDSVLWKLALMARNLQQDDGTRLLAVLKGFHFSPSRAYSFLLKSHLHLSGWSGMLDFLDWWGLDHLQAEDFLPYQALGGKGLMSLAERAHIAYAKALLQSRDRARCGHFLPRLQQLHADHPEMAYPGYFCGKLMVMTGADREAVLDVLVPFVREKSRDFWAWQLLSESYREDAQVQLACLLRAVHCGAQESFLGKVRMRIASLYVAQGEPGRARCHLERVAACYQRQGWHLPLEVREMLGFVCAGGTPPDASPGSDFMEVTNGILARGCQECVAVVTHVDEQARRVAIVYGQERRTALRKKDISGKGVKVGTFLRVLVSGEDPVRVVQASVMDAPVPGLPYVKRVKGIVRRVPEKSFAFVRAKGVNCFLHPALVAQNQLAEGERVSVLAALDLDRKTGKWGWAGLVLLGCEQDTGQQG